MTVARLGDLSHNPRDCHSCPGCCHDVIGPAITGSPDTNLNGRPVLRATHFDGGIHCCCCGPNTWRTLCGSGDIYLNGTQLARLFDCTQHCGGIGKIVTSSSDTNTNY